MAKAHILQTILEELFDCSAEINKPQFAARNPLVVRGDLGDVVAQIIRNVTDENRKALSKATNWIEAQSGGFLVFPYVSYKETPISVKVDKLRKAYIANRTPSTSSPLTAAELDCAIKALL
jgi:Ethanolamine utilization protein EutJ (predicted chaperonin)